MIKIGNYNFDGPYLLSNFETIDKAAIYAILCKNEISGKYRLIYIGQSGEIETRLDSHNQKNCWKNNCNLSNLYIAIFYTPSSEYSKNEREEIERELIDLYNPICNQK